MSKIYEPKTIKDIVKMSLVIPNYQRPYKWTKTNIEKLIMDIEHDRSTVSSKDNGYRYRIGSIIIHKEKNESGKEIVNIVDGQQRLLSICIILHVLGHDSCSLTGIEFSNRDTLDNLRYNSDFIIAYFTGMNENEKGAFKYYLLECCEMIVIEASNIAEAFQMFDSQNARGRKLEPADLLKAFHLRSMTDENEKRMCVNRWEDAIDKELLHPVMSKIIYRSRCWMRKDYSKYYFDKDSIDEFKGIDIDLFAKEKKLYPYMQQLYLDSQVGFYRIDEPIVNGKRFFDYINHYVGIFESLFPAINDFTMESDSDNQIQKSIRSRCFYGKMKRTGDSRIRNVLYCQLTAYYDKFGSDNIIAFLDLVYKYNYHVRLHTSQVRKETIRNELLKAGNPFEWIMSSYSPDMGKLRMLLPYYEEIVSREELNKNAHDFKNY